MVEKVKARRNKRAVGFNDAEFEEIKAKAAKAGLFPRQYILMKVRGK